MPNGKPGDSVHHDIVHLKIPVFGPTCDDLVREISARIPLSHLGELQNIIESWPWNPEGTPRDTHLLEPQLRALLERVKTLPPDPPQPPPPPPPEPPPVAPPSRQERGQRGRLLRGILGFILGAVGFGVVALFLASLLIPMPSGDAAMGTAIMILFLIVPGAALAGGVIGAVLLGRRR